MRGPGAWSDGGWEKRWKRNSPSPRYDAPWPIRAVPEGIIHHSDRGIQYCAHTYVAELKAAGFAISMSRTGNPYDNALAESFMRTLKCEEVYLNQYRDIEDARERIGEFLEDYYNKRRLHSALGYKPPTAFEENPR